MNAHVVDLSQGDGSGLDITGGRVAEEVDEFAPALKLLVSLLGARVKH